MHLGSQIFVDSSKKKNLEPMNPDILAVCVVGMYGDAKVAVALVSSSKLIYSHVIVPCEALEAGEWRFTICLTMGQHNGSA